MGDFPKSVSLSKRYALSSSENTKMAMGMREVDNASQNAYIKNKRVLVRLFVHFRCVLCAFDPSTAR